MTFWILWINAPRFDEISDHVTWMTRHPSAVSMFRRARSCSQRSLPECHRYPSASMATRAEGNAKSTIATKRCSSLTGCCKTGFGRPDSRRILESLVSNTLSGTADEESRAARSALNAVIPDRPLRPRSSSAIANAEAKRAFLRSASSSASSSTSRGATEARSINVRAGAVTRIAVSSVTSGGGIAGAQ